MGTRRTLAGLAAAALMGLGLGAPAAGAQESADREGYGSATGAAELLTVTAGAAESPLVVAEVVRDAVDATIDDNVDGAPTAGLSLAPLGVSLAGVRTDVPPVTVRSSEGTQTEEGASIPLDTAATSGGLVAGQITAVVDEAGARASQLNELVDVAAVAGLAQLDATTVSTGTDANPGTSESTRGVQVDGVALLPLAGVLEALGIPLTSLPADTVFGLLDAVGATLPAGPAFEVEELYGELVAALEDTDALLELVDTGQVSDELCGTVNDTVGGLAEQLGSGDLAGVDCETVDVAAVTTLQEDLTDELTGLVGSVIGTLDGTALVAVDSVAAQLASVAGPTVDTSSATVNAAVGPFRVAGLSVPGVDLTDAANDVVATADQLAGEVNGVLATVHPALGDLVDVRLLEQSTSVAETGGYVEAVASLVALDATVTVPDSLAGIVADVTAGTGLLDELRALGVPVDGLPVAGGDVVALEQQLAGAAPVELLGAGGNVRLADLSTRSNFTVPADTTAAPLPRTGGGDLPLAVAGLAALGAAVGLSRWLRRPTTARSTTP